MTLDVSAIALNRRWEFPPSAYDLISISRQTVSTVVQRGRQFTMWNTSRHRGSRSCASAVALTETNVVSKCNLKQCVVKQRADIPVGPNGRGPGSDAPLMTEARKAQTGVGAAVLYHPQAIMATSGAKITAMIHSCCFIVTLFFFLFFFVFVKYGLFLFGEEVYDI